jgi:AcrR family transcriptional regulator
VSTGLGLSTELGLRERKKQQTRQLLADTARRLFTERGFENVSVAEIARAADVSAPTVFNYFPSKEDLVFSGLESFEHELLQAISDRPAGESVLTAFGRFILRPRGFFAATDKDAAEQLLNLARMIAGSPALLAREREILARYTDSLADLIAEETSATADDPRPRIAADALMGVHRGLIQYVRRAILANDRGPSGRLARDTQAYGKRALALLEDGLGRYAPRRPRASGSRTR